MEYMNTYIVYMYVLILRVNFMGSWAALRTSVVPEIGELGKEGGKGSSIRALRTGTEPLNGRWRY